VLGIFEEQIEFENCVVLPLIFEYEPSVCNHYLHQHDEQTEQLQKLRSLILSFSTTSDEVEQFEILMLIGENFNKFLLSNYHHMDDEEEVFNNILWQYYNDDFLATVQRGREFKSVSAQYLGKSGVLHSATAA
jgi:hypothetical protein